MKRKGVYFSQEEIEALRSDLETAFDEIGEELDSGAYGDDIEGYRKAVRLRKKLQGLI